MNRAVKLISLSAAAAILISSCGTKPFEVDPMNGPAFPVSVDAAHIHDYMNPTAVEKLKENILRAGVNTHSYEFGKIVDTPAPSGYKPFYITHYGRHGSRSNWGSYSYDNVIRVLTQAKETGILSPSGDSLLVEAKAVLEGYNGMDGRLTPRGVREHKMLATRMYSRFGDIFKNGNKIVRVESSTVERCLVSMSGFVTSLAANQPDLDIRMDTGSKIMSYITNGASGRVSAEVGRLTSVLSHSQEVDTVSIMTRLFTDPVAARAFIPRTVDAFQNDVLATACIAEDFDITTNVYRYVPFDAIYRFWDSTNRNIYMQHCNSIPFGGERMHSSKPLVADMLKKADEVLETGAYCADLKFGHDFPLLALEAFLSLEGIGEPREFDDVAGNWFGSEWVSMASNVQLVFYKNSKGNVLVKVLANERETPIIGLTPVKGPYYNWSDYRALIEKKLAE